MTIENIIVNSKALFSRIFRYRKCACFLFFTTIDSINTSQLKLKSSLATYPTSNAKSLSCDTANEHALLERHAAAVRQLSNGTNGDDICICIATVGNTIQTINSPMYDTHMSFSW